MKSVSDIDKNLKVEVCSDGDGTVYRNITSEPFRVYGLIRECGRWTRMPDSVAEAVSPDVRTLALHTAGGRVRFRTDSNAVSVRVTTPAGAPMSHMAWCGQAGFDIYIGDGGAERYVKTLIPPITAEEGYSASAVISEDSRMKTVTLNFPLYHAVNDVYIGLPEGSVLEAAPEYTISTPIVFYGSSITQGGCASRPGNSYQGLVCRHFDADHINLGFSGSAKGEEAMAKYIASLKMSVFVYDYDHNAPVEEHLRKTHEPFFKIIRAAHPSLPVIMMSRPVYARSESELERVRIIKQTYENARLSGDRNVYFIDGAELMELCEQSGTVDGTHPTDLGFFSMAKRLIRELEKLSLFCGKQ